MTNNWLSYGIIDGERSDGEPFAVTVKPGRCIMPAEKAPHGKKARRPKGVSDKMARGDTDVQDAALHSSGRMIAQVYDRRRVRVAKPAG